MVLSRPDLLRRIRRGSVRFDPQVPLEAVKQVSVDLRLGRSFTVFRERPHVAAIRISKELFTENEDLWHTVEADYYTLYPSRFVLAQTLEQGTR